MPAESVDAPQAHIEPGKPITVRDGKGVKDRALVLLFRLCYLASRGSFIG
jgi:hypothetical protein